MHLVIMARHSFGSPAGRPLGKMMANSECDADRRLSDTSLK